ncbi:MAG TPA: hypothetical protein VI729_13080 [Anaerolineales bacterium]|nr:hypothetical protein [Anaerolineales bacterium]
MRITIGLLLCANVSVGLFLLPAGIWTVVTGFDKTLLVFLALIFRFSTVPFEALLDPRLPDWLANPPGLYILNLIPALVIALAAYPILRKSTSLSRVKALCIAGNASLLLLQMVGSLMLYFFIRHSGPYA